MLKDIVRYFLGTLPTGILAFVCLGLGACNGSAPRLPEIAAVAPSLASVKERAPLDALAASLELNRIVTLPTPLAALAQSTEEDTDILRSVLTTFKSNSSPVHYADLETWANSHPQSPWRASVLTNLGLLYYHTGYFSRAVEMLELSWGLSHEATEPRAKALADRTVGELARMHARLGHVDRLRALFTELGDRRYLGSASELINNSKEALWLMENEPGTSFKCGPFALQQVAAQIDPSGKIASELVNVQSGRHGLTLGQLDEE